MNRPRIGHLSRPDRAWEVWNDSYRFRVPETLKLPWAIWHPRIDPAKGNFPTHAQAIAYIAAGDWDA
jgi:hypothetical protein